MWHLYATVYFRTLFRKISHLDYYYKMHNGVIPIENTTMWLKIRITSPDFMLPCRCRNFREINKRMSVCKTTRCSSRIDSIDRSSNSQKAFNVIIDTKREWILVVYFSLFFFLLQSLRLLEFLFLFAHIYLRFLSLRSFPDWLVYERASKPRSFIRLISPKGRKDRGNRF